MFLPPDSRRPGRAPLASAGTDGIRSHFFPLWRALWKSRTAALAVPWAGPRGRRNPHEETVRNTPGGHRGLSGRRRRVRAARLRPAAHRGPGIRRKRKPGGSRRCRHPGRRGGRRRAACRKDRPRRRPDDRGVRPLPGARLGGSPLPRRPLAGRRRHGRAEGGEPRRPGDHHRGHGRRRAEPCLADPRRDRRLRKPRGGAQCGPGGGPLDGPAAGDGRGPRTPGHRRGSRPDGGTGSRGHGGRGLGPRSRPGVPPGALFRDQRDRGSRAGGFRLRRLLLLAPAQPVSDAALAGPQHRGRADADRHRRDGGDDPNRPRDRHPGGRNPHQGEGALELGPLGEGCPGDPAGAGAGSAGLSRPVPLRDLRRRPGRG